MEAEGGCNLEGFHFGYLYCTNYVKMFWIKQSEMCLVRSN